MSNIFTTATEADTSAALEALYNDPNASGLSDTDGEAAVSSVLSSCGDLAPVLSAEGILTTVNTWIWNIVKRIEAKVKSLLEMLKDKIQQLIPSKSLIWNTGSSGGGGS